MLLRLVIGSLRRRAWAHLIAVSAIAVGSLLSSALINLHQDVKAKMSRDLRRYGANVLIVPQGSDAGSIDVRETEKLESPQFRDRIASYAPLLLVAATVRDQSTMVVGSSFQKLKSLNSWWKVEGRWARSESECMAGKAVAQRLGVKLGDLLYLTSDSRAAEAKLVGIVETGGAEENQIFVQLPVAWAIGGPSVAGRLISAVALSVRGDPEGVRDLALRLSEAIPGAEVRPLGRIVEAEGRVLDQIKLTLFVVTALVMALAALCVMTTLIAVTVERGREIALMKALGAQAAKIILLFLSEAAAIGLIGGVIGYGFGLALAAVLEGKIFGSELSFRLSPLAFVLLLSSLTAVVGGVAPTRRALKIDPAQILRGE